MTTTTTSDRNFVEIARNLGAVFAERAAAHDLEGSFVSDNYADLKRHRVLSAGVPEAFGGGGATHAELCQMLRELARHCGSTALTLSMHTHLVAAAVWRHGHGQPADALFKKIADSQAVLVSTGAGDWVDSVGKAERVEGGFRVTASKRFASGSPVGDLLITTAPYDDPEQGAQVIHFALPLKTEGVTVTNDWNAIGMRGTGSNTVEINNAFVPQAAVSLQRPRGKWHPAWSVTITVAPPIYLAPYLGIAERAAELAREDCLRRRSDWSVWQGLGELENSLTIAQMAFREMIELANNYDFQPEVERASRMLVRKTIATNALYASVNKAIELVGGKSLFRANTLERLFRDLQGARFHPLPEKQQQVFTGRIELGLPPVL